MVNQSAMATARPQAIVDGLRSGNNFATGGQLTTALALIELDGIARRLAILPPDADPDHFADLSLSVIKLMGPGEYVLERLAESHGLAPARGAHAEYFAALADQAHDELRGPVLNALNRQTLDELRHVLLDLRDDDSAAASVPTTTRRWNRMVGLFSSISAPSARQPFGSAAIILWARLGAWGRAISLPFSASSSC